MGSQPPTTDRFVKAVGEFVDARGLVAPRQRIVVAVSGGADSVALLAALRELAGQPGREYSLIVAHVNHALRDAADADERFVSDLAERWGLPCVCRRVDVRAAAERSGQGIEQAGRCLRYDVLAQAAREHDSQCVAVGHHADDNVETVLYRVVRGTHIRGLAGIPASRGLGGSDVQIIRPLLAVTRDQVEQYCLRAGLEFCSDHTNADTRFRRNFIRHELLPLLRDRLNPRADEALGRLAQGADEVVSFLDGLARTVLGGAILRDEPRRVTLSRAALDGAPVMRKWVFRSVLERMGAPMRDVGSQRLGDIGRLVDDDGPAAVTLGGGVVARRCGNDEIVIEFADDQPPPSADAIVPLACPGETQLSDGRCVRCRIESIDRDAFEAHRRRPRPGDEMLDADQLRGQLLARPRRSGDVFHPLGAPGRQSVSDFLTNAKASPDARRQALCICDELGIAYLAAFRIDQRVRITDDTRRVLRISVEHPEGTP